jgi:hypothetical protein
MKNIYRLAIGLIFLFHIHTLVAQTFNSLLQVGGTDNNTIEDMVVDASGNYYIVGNSKAAISTPTNTATGSSSTLTLPYLAKINSSGTVVWMRYIRSLVSNSGYKIKVDASGNVFLLVNGSGGLNIFAATFDANASINTTGGNKDGIIAKMDPNGTMLWAMAVGDQGTAIDELVDFTLDANGDVYAVGYVTSATTTRVYGKTYGGTQTNFATIANSATTSLDAVVVKINNAGTYQWGFSLGTAATSEKANAIAVDALNNIYVGGSFGGTVDFNPSASTNNLVESTPQGAGDAFIAKYNSAGAYVWAGSIQGNAQENIRSMHIGSSGSLYIAGDYSGSAVDFDMTAGSTAKASNGIDVFFAKYDLTTQALGFLNTIGGSSTDLAKNIFATSSEVFVTGSFQGTTINFNPNGTAKNLSSNGAEDIFYAKYNASGINTWANAFGSTGSDFGTSVYVSPFDGKLFLGGYSNSTSVGDFDNGAGTASFTNLGLNDAFVAQYTECVAPSITTQPSNLTACSGSNGSLTVGTTGSGITYQWKKSGVNVTNGGGISGATTNTLTFTGITVANAGSYTCDVMSGCAATLTTTAVTITVNALPAITTHPVNATICSGSNASFSVAATGSALTYQWQKGGVNVVNGGVFSGATTATLTITGASSSEAGSYTCIVSGACTPSVTSNAATLTINASPVITTQPTNSVQCQGGNLNFSVVATGVGLTYQWYKNAAILNNSGRVSGATTANLSISPSNSSDIATYTCVVTGTCSPAVTSNAATASITSAPTITTSPTNTTLCEGQNLTFTAVANGAGLSYQWFKGATPLTNGGNISGATAASLVITGLVTTDAGSYTCTVTGACAPTATTTAASLTVNALPKITVQASDVTICAGGNATFALTATGTGISYQWRKNGVNVTNGGVYSGATTNTLTITSATATEAAVYSCVVSGTCTPSVTSSNYNLVVNSVAAITTQPSNQTICEGANLNISIVTSGAGVNYQWFKGASALSNGGAISGATSATLVITGVTTTDAGSYTCQISNICTSTITSSAATVTINAKPVITTQPVGTTICSSANVNFSVVATGTGVTYQWRRNGVNVTNGGAISGATTNTLLITGATGADAGTYTCVVSGTCTPSVTSSGAVLIVTTSSVITTQPTSVNVCTNTATSFNVVVSGSGVTYKWQKDGVDLINGGSISGVSTATLSISSVSAANVGNYTCITGNTCSGTLVSNIASLSIIQSPVINTQPVSQSICTSAPVSFSVAAIGTSVTYQWKKDGVVLTNTANVTGVNTNTLNIALATTSDAGNYTCVVSNVCQTVESNAAIFTVSSNLFIITQPFASSVCSGNSIALDCEAIGGTVTYQWTKNGVDIVNGGRISGAQSTTLVIANSVLLDAADYQCKVISSCGSVLNSNLATITVNQNVSITTQPIGSTICEGSTLSLLSDAIGTGISYKWKKDGIYLSDDVRISGSNTNSITVSNTTLADNGSYECVITGVCGVKVTVPAAVIVNPITKITSQSLSQVVCNGNNINLSVMAVGSNNVFQWYKNGIMLSNTGNVNGVTANTLSITNYTSANSGDYTCEVTGDCGTIVLSSIINLSDATLPTITLQPLNTNSCVNQNVQLIVGVQKPIGAIYQWKYNGTPLSNNATFSGVTNDTLTITNIALANAGNYTCDVSYNCTGASTSNVAILTVNTPGSITSQPIDVSVCLNQTTNFKVVYSGTGVTYKWQFKPTNGVYADVVNGSVYSGATSAILVATNPDLSHQGLYRCLITEGCGMVTTSSEASLHINVPQIVQQPMDMIGCVGQNVTISVVASGPNLTFQWYKDGIALAETVALFGSTTSDLLITNVSNADMGDYYCVITGICAPPATSNVAKLTTTVCTNTTNPFAKEKFFKVYPNPSQSTSNIEFTMGSGEEVKVKVYDLVGNALMEKEAQMMQGNSVEINLENYAEGMYIIYVEKNGVIYTDKLEKIK